MPTEIRLSRKVLRATPGVCSLEAFDASPDVEGDELVTTAEVLASRSPAELLWLVTRKLVPLGLLEARALIRKAHGKGWDENPAKLRHERDGGIEELESLKLAKSRGATLRRPG